MSRKLPQLRKLTPLQEALVREAALELLKKRPNMTRAAIRAGYAKGGAKQSVHRALQSPLVQAALEEEREKIAGRARKKFGISRDRILREVSHMAFSRLTDVLEWDENGVRLKPSEELTPAAAAALHALEITDTQIFDGEGGVVGVKRKTKVRMHPKLAALETAAKLEGYLKDESAGGAAAGVQIIVGGGPMGLERVEVRAMAGAQVRQLPAGPVVEVGE